MQKNIIKTTFLSNLIGSVVVALFLSFIISMFTLPTISNETLSSQEFIQLIDNSEKKASINQIIKNNDKLFIEFKKVEELVQIKDENVKVVKDAISLNKFNVSEVKIENSFYDTLIMSLYTFIGLFILSAVLVYLNFNGDYIKNTGKNDGFMKSFFNNYEKIYREPFLKSLSNYTNPFKNVFFLGLFTVIFSFNMILDNSVDQQTSLPNTYIYSNLIEDIESNNISYVDIKIQDGVSHITATDRLGEKHVFTTGDSAQLKSSLNENKISYDESNLGQSFSWTPYIITFFILLAVMLVVSGIGRALQKKNPLMNGKSFEVVQEKPNVSLKDVKGIDEIKGEISEVVELLNKKQKMNELGGKTPKGILIEGEPGVGKTLLAKAIANETDYNFIYTNGSAFAGQLQGQGADNVRNLFKEARKNQPCIIFIDEIDGVGRKHGSNSNGQDSDRTLNELLTQLDGFDTENDDIVVVGATNFPDKLDPALTRAGRFDREITIPLPNYKGRKEILEMYIAKVKAANNIDLEFIAHHTSGMAGATLENLVNEAALGAGRKGKDLIELEDFEEAQAKLVMGHKLPIEMSEKEKWMTAYHEAGHAIVSLKQDTTHMQVHKVSIIPRGKALGVTMYIPEGEKYSHSKKEIENEISSLYGGRIAEELLMGEDEVTTGASNDFKVATQKAEGMIKHCGLGTDNLLTLGYKDNGYQDSLSNNDKEEMQKILLRNYKKASKTLEENKELLRNMAKALIHFDTIEKEHIDDIMQGKDVTEGKQDVPEEYDILKKDFTVYDKIKDENEDKEEKGN